MDSTERHASVNMANFASSAWAGVPMIASEHLAEVIKKEDVDVGATAVDHEDVDVAATVED